MAANKSVESNASASSFSVNSGRSNASTDSDKVMKTQPKMMSQSSYQRMASLKTEERLRELSKQRSVGKDGRRKLGRASYAPTTSKTKKTLKPETDRDIKRHSIHTTNKKELKKKEQERREMLNDKKAEETRKVRRYMNSRKDLFQGIREDDDDKKDVDPELAPTPRRNSDDSDKKNGNQSAFTYPNGASNGAANGTTATTNGHATTTINSSHSKPTVHSVEVHDVDNSVAARTPLPRRNHRKHVLNPCVSLSINNDSSKRNGRRGSERKKRWQISSLFGKKGNNQTNQSIQESSHHPISHSDEFPANTNFPNPTVEVVEKPKLITYGLNDERYKLYPWLKPQKTLGQGAYATVCSVMDTRTKREYAVKKNRDVFNNVADAKRILREIKLMLHMDHANVMGLVGCIPPERYEMDNFDEIYLVMDKCDTTLKRVITSRQKLSEDHIIYFAYQIARGLQYMHSGNIIHRDLKPENLLINTGNCRIQITDFGLSRGVNVEMDSDIDSSHKLTEYVVTRWYRAPEVMCCRKWYGARIDVWSLGCIIAELYNRKPLWKGRNSRDQLRLIFNIMGTPKKLNWITTPSQRDWIRSLGIVPGKDLEYVMPGSSNLAQDFVKFMLVMDPHKRPNIGEVIDHPFLASRKKDRHYKKCPPFNISFEFEKKIKTTFGVRHMMYEELVQFHKRIVQKEKELLTPRTMAYPSFGFGVGERYELLVTGFINACVDGYRLPSVPFGVAKAICLYSTLCFKFEGDLKRFRVSGARKDVAIERVDDNGWATVCGVESIVPKGIYQWHVLVKKMHQKATPSIRYCDVGIVNANQTVVKRIQDVAMRGGAYGKQVVISSPRTVLKVKVDFESGFEGKLWIGRFENEKAVEPDWKFSCAVPKVNGRRYRFAISMERSGLVLEVDQYTHEMR